MNFQTIDTTSDAFNEARRYVASVRVVSAKYRAEILASQNTKVFAFCCRRNSVAKWPYQHHISETSFQSAKKSATAAPNLQKISEA